MVSTSVVAGSSVPPTTTQAQKSVSVAKATFSSTAITAKGAESDDVVTFSKSMEKLLDGFTGGKTAKVDDDNGSGAQSSAGSSSGSGQFNSAALDRAREAEGIMNRIQQASDQFAKGLGKALQGMSDNLGSTLSQLGMSDDDVNDVLGGFKSDMASKANDLFNTLSQGPGFGQMALDYQSSATQFSIETSGIDVVIQDGDRKMVVSYAKSTLDLKRQDESLQAQFGADGSGAVAVGASTTTAQGKAEGLIVNAKGFSADEVQQVLDRLNDIQSGGASGSGNLSVLTPEKRADGTMKLKLNLSSILPPATESSSSTAAAETPTTTAAAATTASASTTPASPALNISV